MLQGRLVIPPSPVYVLQWTDDVHTVTIEPDAISAYSQICRFVRTYPIEGSMSEESLELSRRHLRFMMTEIWRLDEGYDGPIPKNSPMRHFVAFDIDSLRDGNADQYRVDQILESDTISIHEPFVCWSTGSGYSGEVWEVPGLKLFAFLSKMGYGHLETPFVEYRRYDLEPDFYSYYHGLYRCKYNFHVDRELPSWVLPLLPIY